MKFGVFDEVKNMHFQFKQDILEDTENRIKTVRAERENTVLIGIHVRRTDYGGYRLA